MTQDQHPTKQIQVSFSTADESVSPRKGAALAGVSTFGGALRVARLMPGLMAGLVAGFVGVSCSSGPRGATDEGLAHAKDVAAAGADLYATKCSSCHGDRGEGRGAAPMVLGRGALPEYPRSAGGSGDPTLTDPTQLQIQMQTRPAGAPSRDPFRNAQDLFRFVRTEMPKSAPGSLSNQNAWDLVNFLLAAQGGTLPPGGANPQNATAIPIPRP